MSSKSYVAMDVWQRLSETRLVCFRCFRVLPDDTFCVQSADFFKLPLDPALLDQSREQFLELLADEAPEVRGQTHASLEQAIAAHKRLFE